MAEVKPITTRNTFAATLKSIPLQIAALDRLEVPTATAVVSMLLSDADRIVATMSADESPDWVAREVTHGDWSTVSTAVDKLRDAYSGKTLADLRADTAATDRAVKRLTGSHTAAAKATARNVQAHAAYDAIVKPAQARKS